MDQSVKSIKALFEIARPQQWIKNAFVFAPLLFAKEGGHIEAVQKTFAAFLLFCIYSSCVYMINDIADVERDKLHPEKKFRPLPSGRLSTLTVWITCLIFFVLATVASFYLSLDFLTVVLIYSAINLLYSFWWKTVVILDGMIIALGFVLRTYAGAVVIDVNFSDWLYICATFVSLFLAFCKRRHEIYLLGEDEAKNHRAILKEYTAQLLDQIIAIVTAATAVTYSLYCIDASRTANDPNSTISGTSSSMKFTIPFVLYGLFRYLYLVYRKDEGGNPTEVLLSDKPLLINGCLWLAVVFWSLYFG